METKEPNKESQDEIPVKEENTIKPNEEEKKQEQGSNQIEENKINEENPSDIKNEETKNENQNDEKNQENPTENKEKETKDETIDPHLIFQKELLNIINKQEKILTSTSTINEKFGVSNEITKEQISSFKANIDKYGKYLIMIKKELGIISSTMQKIKKLAKENDNKVLK